MKKSITFMVVIAALAGILALTGCTENKKVSTATFKVGILYIGDETEGYTSAHMKGIAEMKSELGVEVIERTRIPESEDCYATAVELAEMGCNLIIGTSFGHEKYIIRAAAQYPRIQFACATGYMASKSGLKNMHNYMPSVYEARYISGIVAGLKLESMVKSGEIKASDVKVGYVGAYPYAEVISGYTAFFLGVRSILPEATMEVIYTNSWGNFDLEKQVAEQLISDGCVLISQHSDTKGAPTICEEKHIPCVGYNVDMIPTAPTTALTSAAINWGAYYKLACRAFMTGENIEADWSKGYLENAVYITPVSKKFLTPQVEEKINIAQAELVVDRIHVFDTSTFRVNGKILEDLVATEPEYKKYEKLVRGGYFHEQEKASAPAFDIIIDGITVK